MTTHHHLFYLIKNILIRKHENGSTHVHRTRMIPNVIRRVAFQYCKLHFLLRTRPLSHVMYSGSTGLVTPVADPSLLDCSRAAAQDVDGFAIISNFVSSEEEEQLMVDIRRTLRGRKYLYDHWDGVSTSMGHRHGYE